MFSSDLIVRSLSMSPTSSRPSFNRSDPDRVQFAIADIDDRVVPIEVSANNAGLQHREPLLEVSLAGTHPTVPAVAVPGPPWRARQVTD